MVKIINENSNFEQYVVGIAFKCIDGEPYIVSGTNLSTEKGNAVDRQYYRGDYMFKEKVFDNIKDAKKYQAMFDRYIGQDFSEVQDIVDESLTVNERHDPVHFLSNNPTDYERYLNYAETLVIVCENLAEAAERCLRRIEDNEEFYTDPKNERWYGFDEKMDQIAKVMRQVESLTNKIDKKM